MNKTIQLNPEYLTTSGSTSTSKQKKTPAVKPAVPIGNADNILKHTLLNRIKSHKKTKQKQHPPEAAKTEKSDEFSESLDFLRELSEKRAQDLQLKKQRKQLHNTTLKNTSKNTMKTSALNFDVQTELPQELLDVKAKNMPKQSVAAEAVPIPVHHKPLAVPTHVPNKSVTAPTHVPNKPLPINVPSKPVPNKPVPNKPVPIVVQPVPTVVQPVPTVVEPVPTVVEPVPTVAPLPDANMTVLADPPAYGNLKNGSKPTFKQLTQKNKQTTELAPAVPLNTKKFFGKSAKRRITKTLKYNLGKQKNGKHISVYIKNEATRNLINAERKTLKNTSFQDIKTYLRQKNLLKIGSEITPDLAHHLYENAILAGDVTNQSNEHMRHNFFNKGMD